MTQQRSAILQSLGPFGLSKEGARRLANVEGIDDILNKDVFPPNNNVKPECLS